MSQGTHPLCRVAWLFIILTFPNPVHAHEDLDKQIAMVTKQIAEAPANATLYLKRGELHRAHREWDAALADYDRAAELDPSIAAADLSRGLMFLDAGSPEAAKVSLDHFLARNPEHPVARVARARALVKLGRPLEAAEDFTCAITRLSKPNPEYYFERARALAAGERFTEALAGLDEGIRALGPLVTLQVLAVDLELKRNRYDGALARLDQLVASAPRKETWLASKGEVLEQAGRVAEAREAYSAALRAIESLPGPRRKNKAVEELEARSRAAIERLVEKDKKASDRSGFTRLGVEQ